MRYYAVVIKVSKVARSTLEGHFISFLQDSLEKAAAGLEERVSWLQGAMHVAFVGPQGEWDTLKHRLIKLRELRTRSHVMFNLMTIRQCVIEAYNVVFGDITPELRVPSYEDCQVLIDGLGEHLVESARIISDKSMEAYHVCQSDDIAQVRDAPPDEHGPPTLSHVALLASHPTLSESTASRLHAVGNLIVPSQRSGNDDEPDENEPANVPEEPTDAPPSGPPVLRIARADDPQNEFLDNGRTIMRMQPHLFLLAHNEPSETVLSGRVSVPLRAKGAISTGSARHLLLQYHCAFATCIPLIMQMANQTRRHAALRSLNLRVDHDKFESFESYYQRDDVKTNLAAAAADPRGPEARQLKRDLLPLLSISGRDVPWGKGERGALTSKLLGVQRRHGSPDFFVTVSPNDKNHPTCIRLSIGSMSNTAFPAVADDSFFQALRHGEDGSKYEGRHELGERALHCLSASNPVAAAVFFDRLVNCVLSILFQLPPSSKSRATKPLHERPKGILGTCVAHVGAKEVTGKKALHIHWVLFCGGISSMMSSLADHPTLAKELKRALDSLLTAELSFEVYLLDDARRVLSSAKPNLHVKPRRPSYYPPRSLEGSYYTERGAPFGLPFATELDLAHYQSHGDPSSDVASDRHSHTCKKVKPGSKKPSLWCRGNKPSPHGNETTRIVQLRRRGNEIEGDCNGKECEGCKTNQSLRDGCICDGKWFHKNFGKYNIEWTETIEPAAHGTMPAAPLSMEIDPANVDVPSEIESPQAPANVVPAENDDAQPLSDGPASHGANSANGIEVQPIAPEVLDAERRRTNAERVSAPFHKRDRRALAVELRRPIVKVPPDAQMPELRRQIRQQLDASFEVGSIEARATVIEAIKHLEANVPQPMCEEARAICDALNTATDTQCEAIVRRWRKIACRNGSLVEHARVLSMVLQWNTAPYFLGSGEGARAAMYYLAKYVSKDSVALSASLAVLVDVKDHVDKWPSHADDASTSRRKALHFGQRALNSLDMELADTQAASCVLGYAADISSEIFLWYDPWAVLDRARSLIGDTHGTSSQADVLLGVASDSEGSDVEIGSDTRHGNEPDVRERASKRGSGQIYAVGDRKMVLTPMDHYVHSGDALEDMSPYEYTLLIAVEQRSHSAGVAAGTRKTVARWEFATRTEDVTVPRDVQIGETFMLDATSSPTGVEFEVVATVPAGEKMSAQAPVYKLHPAFMQAARAKIPCPRVAGKVPPKPPSRKEGAAANSAWLKAVQAFAAFVVANFVPWPIKADGTRKPRELSVDELSHWFEKLNEEASGVEPKRYADAEETVEEYQDRLAAWNDPQTRQHLQRLATVRLADLSNFFSADWIDKEVKALCSAFRNRNREHWDKPIFKGSGGAGDDDGVQRNIQELRERAEARKVDPKRVIESRQKTQFMMSLLASLPATPPRAAASEDVLAGPRDWRERPSTELGVLSIASADDARQIAKKLRDARPPPPPPLVTHAAAWDGLTDLDAIPDELTELHKDELKRLAAEWKRDHALAYKEGVAGTPFPPLNATQRAFGRKLFDVLCVLHRAKQQGLPIEHAMRDLQMCHLLVGAAGTGKTELLGALDRILQQRGMGRILYSSYIGVACTLLPGRVTTLCTLFGMPGEVTSRDVELQPMSANQELTFNSFAGKSDDIALVALDEASFLTGCITHHLERRMRYVFGRPHVQFGGVPLVFSGDFWQLPPVAGTPIYAALVLDALSEEQRTELELKWPDASGLGAFAKGIKLLKGFQRTVLHEQMRAADDEHHARNNDAMRSTTAKQPVSEAAIDACKPLEVADVLADPSWRFPPIVVLSHIERDELNLAQAREYAKWHGLLLIRWRLELVGANAMTLDGNEVEQLYEHRNENSEVRITEAGLWGIFVAGMPGILNSNVAVANKLANGTRVTYHSLTFDAEGEEQFDLDEAIQACVEQGDSELVLDRVRPCSINVVPSSLKKADRDELKRLELGWIDPTTKDVVVPILLKRQREKVTLTSVYAAEVGAPSELEVRIHASSPAFAGTDFKFQGKTEPRIIQSLSERPFKPYLSLPSFYMMRTRTRCAADQRVLGFDPTRDCDRARLRALRHPPALAIWDASYDKHGRWDAARAAKAAAAACAQVRRGAKRKRSRAAGAASSNAGASASHASASAASVAAADPMFDTLMYDDVFDADACDTADEA